MNMISAIVPGFLLDMILGDPEGLPHPVILMGACISRLEFYMRPRFSKTPRGEFLSGMLLALIVTAMFYFIPACILSILDRTAPAAGWILRVYWCWRILAVKNMADEGRRVYLALSSGDLPAARTAVGRIVGRDTENLDQTGVTRAAVESIAENYTDGVVSPLLYVFLGGVPLAMAFKAVSTMDSMIGYRTERYQYFGRTAAKLDDAMNYLPARIAACCWILAARITGQDAKNAYRIWRRDARKTDSPNAGQTEAACAGALGIRLGGPARYFGQWKAKAYLGDDRRPAEPEDIPRASRMFYAASIILLAALILIYFISQIL